MLFLRTLSHYRKCLTILRKLCWKGHVVPFQASDAHRPAVPTRVPDMGVEPSGPPDWLIHPLNAFSWCHMKQKMYPAEPCPSSWPIKSWTLMKWLPFSVKPLSFGLIGITCYGVTDYQNNHPADLFFIQIGKGFKYGSWNQYFSKERRYNWHPGAFLGHIALKMNICGWGFILISSGLVSCLVMHMSPLDLKRLDWPWWFRTSGGVRTTIFQLRACLVH